MSGGEGEKEVENEEDKEKEAEKSFNPASRARMIFFELDANQACSLYHSFYILNRSLLLEPFQLGLISKPRLSTLDKARNLRL